MYIVVQKTPHGGLRIRRYVDSQFPWGLDTPKHWQGDALFMNDGADKYHLVWTRDISRDDVETALGEWLKD